VVSRRSAALVVTLAVGIAVALAAGRDADKPSAARGGGTLRIVTPVWVDSLDPALAMAGGLAWILEFGTCGTLMAFRNGASPVRPEAAAAPPRIARDGRTYVFTLRPGLRFSDGRPLTETDGRIHHESSELSDRLTRY